MENDGVSVKRQKERESVLLLLLPYWAPFVPPLGIACLKSFLQQQGFRVWAHDANIAPPMVRAYKAYLSCLRAWMPEDKQSNYYNLVNDVLRDHMMAYLHKTTEAEYIDLIRLIIQRTFYWDTERSQIRELDAILSQFYAELERYVLNQMHSHAPTVLGISVLNGTLPASLFAFKLVKERFPHVKTVMGGAVFTGELTLGSPNFTRLIENTPYIDKIIVGEGERLFLKYLQGDLPQSQRVFSHLTVQDVMLDLTQAVSPDLSDFDLNYYPNLVTYASRGCPFRCSFCSETNYWGGYRRRPIDQVVRELSEMATRYRRQTLLLGDSLTNPLLTPLSQELLKRRVRVWLDSYLRANRAVSSGENVTLWREAGLYRARLGLESGSQRVLDIMGKGMTTEQMAGAVSALAKAGIKTTTYWVVGHPGETEDDFRSTLECIERLKDDIYEADCNPFNYYFTGQSDSEKWSSTCTRHPLYPEDTNNMLMTQTWVLETEPSRQLTYDRVSRFVEHCRRLGIPNPYSLYEIHQADKRWQALHANAVPPLAMLLRC